MVVLLSLRDQQKRKSKAELIASLNETERNKFYSSLTEQEAKYLEYDWDFWARPQQKTPDIDWSTWLILAGRGWGKTRTGAEQVRKWVNEGVKRIALVAETPADARDIMVEGESGLLNVFPPNNKPIYEPSKRRIVFHTGATATIYSGANPDQLRGPQHEKAWADELASWDYPEETWDNLMMGLRLGDNPQTVVTTTPRPIKIIKNLIKDENTHITKGSTFDNKSNLPDAFYKKVINKYKGTRLGRQELYAEILSDAPGALWNYEIITHTDEHPDLQRVVVAIDPATTNKDDSDETGIIVAGLGRDNYGYILADYSGKYTPNGWANKAVNAYQEYSADRIVGETNQGGDMVENVIRGQSANVSYKEVRATRGKQIRAEPIASLYEQGKVFHIGQLSKLEDQLCTWEPGNDSPDRLDALVWALTELMLGNSGRIELW